MKALLEEKLGSWHKQPSEPDQVPAVPNTPIPQFAPGADTVYLVDRPGLTQASAFIRVNFVSFPLLLIPWSLILQSSVCHLLGMAMQHSDDNGSSSSLLLLL